MNIPAMPKLSSLVWPVIVALSLAGLLYMTITLKADNIKLTKDIATIQADIKKVKETNNTNTVIYVEQKAKDQQLVKDAGRKDLLFKKPGLIEIKINKSFDEYMQEYEK